MSHPYRQKAAAPYPIEAEDDEVSQPFPVEPTAPRPLSPSPPPPPPHTHQNSRQQPAQADPRTPRSPLSDALAATHLAPGRADGAGTGNGFGNAGLSGPKFSHRPQPSQDSSSSGSHVSSNPDATHAYPQSPPPVFGRAAGAANAGSRSGTTSPTFRSHSANSSITNFNLNHMAEQRPASSRSMSYSESNLNVTTTSNATAANAVANAGASGQSPLRYGHSRAVSSSSSFFNDRSDTISVSDNGHNIIQQYLGQNSHRSVPRIKTLELYRQNAKKSNDPMVLFQYAQYMLQTALMMDGDVHSSTAGSDSGESTPRKSVHVRTKSSSSLALDRLKPTDESAPSTVNDGQLKKELLKEALRYLRRLADKGYVDAQYLLADAHSSGALGKVENKYAFALFQAAAKHGHVESAYRTSYCYEEGLGTGRDARKAIDYLKMAAFKNHPAAMYKLGVYSFYNRMGMGNNVNVKQQGIKWLTRAANIATELTASAPYELGKIYFSGFKDILIKDEKYALELYSQAAALGHVESARILGHYYEIGEIVPQDSNLSIHYYTQAAMGGDAEAMLAMCAWYLVGSEPFLPKDDREAFEWAKRSAQANFTKAKYALGNFYEKGVGCEKSLQESQQWYKRAAEDGDEKSLKRVLDKDWVAQFTKGKKPKKRAQPSPASTLDSDKRAAQEKECVIV
ncbi:Protein SKT5 [[Candida] zeylanoides]